MVECRRCLLGVLDPRQQERAADLLGLELDLVAGLHPLEHRRGGHLKHHGHRRHVELLDRTVTQGDFFRVLVDTAHLALGKFDDAAKNFDRALEIWPRCADAWVGRAGCDARRNRPADALNAAKARNVAMLNTAGDRLVAACEACHKKFKPGLTSMGIYKSPNYPPKY